MIAKERRLLHLHSARLGKDGEPPGIRMLTRRPLLVSSTFVSHGTFGQEIER